MVRGVAEGKDGELTSEAIDVVAQLATECETVLIGPGMGSPGHARDLVGRILPELAVPVVLDALALAAVTFDHGCLSHVEGRAVLTPNADELARTLAWDAQKVDADLREAALRLAARTGVCVSAGGTQTWTAHPDGRSWQGSVGARGLGASGSGDVKAGS